MPTPHFDRETAIALGRKGGLAKRGSGFKQKAQEWVRQHGFDTAVEWIEGESDRRATFAMGILFSYALGRPAEVLQIEDKKEILLRLASDPTLNELAQRFGSIAVRVREIEDGSVVDGESTIQAEEAPARRL